MSSPSAFEYSLANDFISLVNKANSSFALAKPLVFLMSDLDGSLSSSSFKSSFMNLAFALSKSPLYNCLTILRPKVSSWSKSNEWGLPNPYIPECILKLKKI